MKDLLDGQCAIVTGGARGIGLGIAQRLASEGCRVALWDLAFETFDTSTAGFSPSSMHTVDVADYAQQILVIRHRMHAVKRMRHVNQSTLPANLGDRFF